MAFSLSPPPPSRALGRNGGLVVLFKLFVLLDFASGAAFRAVVAHQVRAESIERNNLVRVSFEDCGARHAADDAGVFTLRNGHSARRLDRAEPLGPVKAAGGMTIAQSEDTCVVSGMPRAAILKGYANKIIPLDGLSSYLVSNYGAERGATCKVEKNEKLEKNDKTPVSSQRS